MFEFVTRKDALDKYSLVGARREVDIHAQGLDREFLYVTEYLCDELRLSIETEMRKAIPTDMCIAMTLWFIATGADYRTIGRLFGVSKSTVC